MKGIICCDMAKYIFRLVIYIKICCASHQYRSAINFVLLFCDNISLGSEIDYDIMTDGRNMTKNEHRHKILFDAWYTILQTPNEPVHEKNNNLGFRPGLTQTRLYSHRRWLEAGARSLKFWI